MNREQYLAKRLWLRGTPSSDIGGVPSVAADGYRSAAQAVPSSSLADHYRRLHYLAERDRRDIRN